MMSVDGKQTTLASHSAANDDALSPDNSGQNGTRLGKGWKRLAFPRAILLSLFAHLALPVVGLLFLWVLGYLRPENKPVEHNLEFTLVKHPSSVIPKQPDAKGDKPQLAGGTVRHVSDAESPHPALPQEQHDIARLIVAHLKPSTAAHPVAPPPLVVDDTEDAPQSSPTPETEVPVPLDASKMSDTTPDNQSVVQPAGDAASSVGDAANNQLAVTPDAMAPYFAELKKRLTRNWHPPRGENSLQVVVLFSLKKTGEVESVDIKESSGDKAVDAAAIAAVRQSSPLEALPEAWGVTTSLPILFTFDYTVFGKRRVAQPQ